MTVVQYCQKPLTYYQGILTTAGNHAVITVHPMFYNNGWRTEPDFLALGTSFYSYWRGSIKYLFHFVGTPFYSCRIKISVHHSATGITTTGEGTGFYSKVVDIKGDAFVEFTVPFLQKRMWGFTQMSADDNDETQIILEALTDVQGSSLPASASYYFTIYRAAGPDYQLGLFSKWRNLTPASEVFEKQCSIAQKFREPFEGISPLNTGFIESGVCMADTSSTITDCCRRYCRIATTTRNRLTYPCGSGQPSIFYEGPFLFWSRFFAFWRGGRRLRLMDFSQPSVSLDGLWSPPDTVSSPFDGQGVTTTSNADFWNVTVPYYSSTAWSYAMGVPSYTPGFDDPETAKPWNPPSSYNYWLAAADDFVFLYPIAPVITGLLFEEAKSAVVPDKVQKFVKRPNVISTDSPLASTTDSLKKN